MSRDDYINLHALLLPVDELAYLSDILIDDKIAECVSLRNRVENLLRVLGGSGPSGD